MGLPLPQASGKALLGAQDGGEGGRKYAVLKCHLWTWAQAGGGAGTKEPTHLLDERLLEQGNERIRPWNVDVNLENRSHSPDVTPERLAAHSEERLEHSLALKGQTDRLVTEPS